MTRAHVLWVPLAVLVTACSPSPTRPHSTKSSAPFLTVEQEEERAARAIASLERKHPGAADRREFFQGAARVAWSFVDRHVQPATGLVSPLGSYPYATIWDIGSMLAAFYSARGLGFIDQAAYDAKIRKVLATLSTLRLYDGRVFNKSYDTRNGAMIDGHGPPGRGLGWSATDLGRLLMWLKVVSDADPSYRAATDAIVHRNDFSRIVKDGYLWGEDFNNRGQPHRYQEGRIGYEQYAASGFGVWSVRADKALNLRENAVPITLMGESVPADARRWDRLTNEPFLLLGLEIGWDRQTTALVRRLMRVQEARFGQTGLLTVTGEDAIDQPPYFFYYYCVYTNGKAFGVDVQDRRASVEGPRWVSAKSAFGFQTLIPNGYSELAIRRLDKAGTPGEGWASGVYEANGQSTGNLNINTAAVILSAALVNERGEPLLPSARRELYHAD